MSVKIQVFASCFLFCALLAFSSNANSKIKLDNWLELKSQHFTLYTDVGEAEARQRILDLELLHAVVLRVTNAPDREFTVPTHIYLFRRAGDFKSLIPKETSYVGFFRSGIDLNLAALQRKSLFLDSNAIIFQGYSHQLLRNGSSNYPRWYDEGLSVMLASVEVKDGNIILGGESSRLQGLQDVRTRLSLSKVFSRDDLWNNNKYLRSYMTAISWATINYMYTGFMAGFPNYGDMIPEYLRLINQQTDREQAFETAFGITTFEMEKEVYEYFQLKRRGVLAIPVDRFPHDQTVQVNK